MNISWKFEAVIFINHKDMSVRTCMYETFLNMTCDIININNDIDIFLHYVQTKPNNQ